MKKRLLSLLLIFTVFMTSLPLSSAGAASEPVVDEMIAKVEGYYTDTLQLSPTISLTAFALQAADLDSIGATMPGEADLYDYSKRTTSTVVGKRGEALNVLALSDQIFDGIARDENVEQLAMTLCNLQKEDGWFAMADDKGTESFSQAKAILALDAVYGRDHEVEWPGSELDSLKNRLGALRVLLESQVVSGKDSGKFPAWVFVGNAMGRVDMIYTNNLTVSMALPMIALSGYRDCPISYDEHNTFGQKVNVALDLSTEQIKAQALNDTYTAPNIMNYIIPALVASSQQELAEGLENNKGQNIFEEFFHKKQAADGGFPMGKLGSPANRAMITEFNTQQALIALSDLATGESAYKRIITPYAQAVNALADDGAAISLPDTVKVKSQDIGGGNNTASLGLPFTGEQGSTIQWTSSNEKVIDDRGLVTFPDLATPVTLTAKLDLDSVTKEKTFQILVESKLSGQGALLLEQRIATMDAKYALDITSLGQEGIFALASAGKSLSGYQICELTGGITAAERGKNVIQLVLAGENPYAYNGNDYVRLLAGDDSFWTLIALDLAGGKVDTSLLEAVVSFAGDDRTSATDRALAACALANHRGDTRVKAAIDGVSQWLGTTQKDGQFGPSLASHCAAISALVADGQDLFGLAYTQGNQTILGAIQGSEETSLAALSTLGDLASGQCLWQRTQVSQAIFEQSLSDGKKLLDDGKGLYSEKTLTNLDIALTEALDLKPEEAIGAAYFKLKSAIAGLSTSILPIFDDLRDAGYPAEAVAQFGADVSALQEVAGDKPISTADLTNLAKQVASSYRALAGEAEIATVAMMGQRDSTAFEAQRATALLDQANGQTNSQTGQKAQVMLDVTKTGFDGAYGYDLSQEGGYWGVFEAAAMGKDLTKYKVFDVTTHKNGLLITYQATDYAAIILQLVLTGENPYDYNGINYVAKLQAIDSKNEGYFGPYANNIWALMALDAAGGSYSPGLLKTVTKQVENPSFDLDMRGWALCALANHRDNPEVEAGIQEAIAGINGMQIASGEYAGYFKHIFYTNNNINTHSCVVSGLVAVGEDLTAPKWTKDGQDPLDILQKFQLPDGRFYYTIIDGNLFPAYNKDPLIAIGDAVLGSNVWQRAMLTKDKLNEAIIAGEGALANAQGIVPLAKKSALEAAIKNAAKVTDIRGNGEKYYKLISATNNLTMLAMPKFTDESQYTYNSFQVFQEAVTASMGLLNQGSTTALGVNQACEAIVNGFTGLVVAPTGPSVPPGGGDGALTGESAYIHVADPSGQTYFQKAPIEITEDETAFSLLLKTKLDVAYDAQSQYGVYVRGIDGLWEFDQGPQSGWMYRINGSFPSYSAALHPVSKGDYVEWLYTRDLGKDLGGYVPGVENKPTAPENVAGGDKVTVTTETTAKTDVAGKATARVDAEAMADTLQKAVEATKDGGTPEVRIAVQADSTATSVATTVPRASLTDVMAAKAVLSVETPLGTLNFDNEALVNMLKGARGEDVVLAIAKTDLTKLPDAMQKALKDKVGAHPIYDLSVLSDGKNITSFGQGKVMITVPYTLGEGEESAQVVVYYVADDATMTVLSGVSYDTLTKLLSFATNHFSYYALGYDAKVDVKSGLGQFADVNSWDWFQESVAYLVGKGIMQGTSKTTFAPLARMTRAEFAQTLYGMAKTGGLVSGQAISNGAVFADVSAEAWYAEAVAWAYAEGVVAGVQAEDGTLTFAPEAKISRQDMSVMIKNYTDRVAKYTLTVQHESAVFVDQREIASYATIAVDDMQQAGILSGIKAADGSVSFAPLENASRAEAATMVATLLKSMTK